MIKRYISILILTVIVLHGSSRLGLISYLYTHRHDIAFAIGLTSERVIAMCNGAYHTQVNLVIQDTPSDQIPTQLFQASEIILDYPPGAEFFLKKLDFFPTELSTHYLVRIYSSPRIDIFRPPALTV